MTRIHLISSPRNLSTALMYSFANRPDTQVIDEPMYAHYLLRSGVKHPAGKKVLASMHHEVSEIMSDYIFPRLKKPVYFIKNMAHHFLDMDPSFILNLKNVILIRDPKLIIRSFAKVIEHPNIQDIGIRKESELFDFLILNNQNVIVIDSADILKNPERALRALCKELNIDFYSKMLRWKKGPRPEDGPWAKYWYKTLHSSTGFKKSTVESVILPKHLETLYQEALPYFQKLKKHSIKI